MQTWYQDEHDTTECVCYIDLSLKTISEMMLPPMVMHWSDIHSYLYHKQKFMVKSLQRHIYFPSRESFCHGRITVKWVIEFQYKSKLHMLCSQNTMNNPHCLYICRETGLWYHNFEGLVVVVKFLRFWPLQTGSTDQRPVCSERTVQNFQPNQCSIHIFWSMWEKNASLTVSQLTFWQLIAIYIFSE